MSRVRSSLVVLSLACGLAACMGGPPRPAGPRGEPPGGQPGGPRPIGPAIFISPFGQVWQAEPGRPYPSADWFAAVDADTDGRVDLAEFTRNGLSFFDDLDTDDDGVISFAENAAYETGTLIPATRTRVGGPDGGPSRGGGSAGAGGGPGGPGGPGRGGGRGRGGSGPDGGGPGGGGAQQAGAAPFSLLNVPQPVRGSDLNIDQRITRAEFEQAAGRWFRLIDTDGDGVLTPETLPVTAAHGLNRPPGDDRGPS